MKKFISTLLAVSLFMLSIVPANAAALPRTDTATPYIGEIMFQSVTPATRVADGSEEAITISYEKNDDGSFSIYQYENGTLTEKHTTIPGSGTVDHIYYHSDGTYTQSTEITQYNTQEIATYVNSDPNSSLSSGASTRPLGYMYYNGPLVKETHGIRCYVIDEQHINQPYTFRKGVGKSTADWISTILSVWGFSVGKLGATVVELLFNLGIFNGVLGGVLTVATEKTVRCTFYNQEIHGEPSQPTGKGKHGRLDGAYCFLDIATNRIKTEGYTVRDWGDNSMGRLMFYKVFAIDESPSWWTNT